MGCDCEGEYSPASLEDKGGVETKMKAKVWLACKEPFLSAPNSHLDTPPPDSSSSDDAGPLSLGESGLSPPLEEQKSWEMDAREGFSCEKLKDLRRVSEEGGGEDAVVVFLAHAPPPRLRLDSQHGTGRRSEPSGG